MCLEHFIVLRTLLLSLEWPTLGLSPWEPQIPQIRQGLGGAGSVGSGWIWRRGSRSDGSDENQARDRRSFSAGRKWLSVEDAGKAAGGSGSPQCAVEEVWGGQGKWWSGCWDALDLGLKTIYPRACLMVPVKSGGPRYLQEVISVCWVTADGLRLAGRAVAEVRLPQGTLASSSCEPSMASGCGLWDPHHKNRGWKDLKSLHLWEL